MVIKSTNHVVLHILNRCCILNPVKFSFSNLCTRLSIVNSLDTMVHRVSLYNITFFAISPNNSIHDLRYIVFSSKPYNSHTISFPNVVNLNGSIFVPLTSLLLFLTTPHDTIPYLSVTLFHIIYPPDCLFLHLINPLCFFCSILRMI